MEITISLFEAFLKCPTKCWLRATNEQPTGNEYAEWVKTQNDSYRVAETERLRAQAAPGDFALSPPVENLKTAQWRLAVDVAARTSALPSSVVGTDSTPSQESEGRGWNASLPAISESHLHAVERVPSEGRGKAAQFIPVRFIFFNKFTKDDKLLLAFDAFVLSAALGREITAGRIMHGDVRSCARESAAIFPEPASGQLTGTTSEITTATLSRAQPQVLKVKTFALASEVRKRLEKMAALLSSPTPPDLVLNRHCGECEFQARCRKIAVEKDDLSLLANMSAKERQKLRSKGIFTVTQLSYTFRPRRRPKRMRDKREKYHHSLKALAIREKKIHIVGSPELKIEGTPVYLDVEGLPDRDFYYLIGLRVGHGDSAVQQSLWADTVADEGKIWREFLGILETIEKPVLIHYGSYETTFLKRMRGRFGGPAEGSTEARAINSPLNFASFLFARVYFPTHSNGLKEIGTWLGCKWSSAPSSGTDSIIWRVDWEQTFRTSVRQKLTTYNLEDCVALQRLAEVSALIRTDSQQPGLTNAATPAFVLAESQAPSTALLRRFSSPISDFELINKAARWDFQRDRIYIRTDAALRRIALAARARAKQERTRVKKHLPINTTVLPSQRYRLQFRPKRRRPRGLHPC